MGRKTKYHDERCAKIVRLIRDGNTQVCAARASGVCKSTFYEWLKLYPDFSDSITQAESLAEADAVRSVKIAFQPHLVRERKTVINEDGTRTITETVKREHKPEMAIELLKRRWKKDWSERVEQTGPGGEPIATEDLSPITEDDRKRRIAELLDRSRHRDSAAQSNAE